MNFGRIVPKPLRQRLRNRLALRQATADSRSDARRYRKYAAPREGAIPGLTPMQIEAQVTRDYHRVEKGLALPSPKQPFGMPLSDRLSALLPVSDRDTFWYEAGISAVEALDEWNSDAKISDEIAPKKADRVPFGVGGPDQFFRSRQSVRNFAQTVVDKQVVSNALELALHSPSVCNRQPWRLRLYRGSDVSRILAHQNGNRGFRGSVQHLALITVELGYFNGSGERNQAWIEGGIFAANFVLALHAAGVDSCMLNLSLPEQPMEALRVEAQIPASEAPIMMVAFGYAADGARVARSPRRQYDDVVRYNTREEEA